MTKPDDTIAAVSTGPGGAIAVVRLSGSDAVSCTDAFFQSVSGRKLSEYPPARACFGRFTDRTGETVDEVLVVRFSAPHSYTGEDVVEISCHGSAYIQQTILSLLTEGGARMAAPGEFTQRAYLNGKLDLVQAEAVADIIAADSKASHQLAMNQMKGGYSQEFSLLRGRLLDLASLLELELDFSEEDVEFADRRQLCSTLMDIRDRIDMLARSFQKGNAIKNGIPVAIVGRPNAGKSTLLNALLREDRAIVSDIAGTTRDVIEETMNIGGTIFRFIDTAGIRRTSDTLENLGIERTYERMRKAALVLFVAEAGDVYDDILREAGRLELTEQQQLIVLLNKSDLCEAGDVQQKAEKITEKLVVPVYILSARQSGSTSTLEQHLATEYAVNPNTESILISNIRHYEILSKAMYSADAALQALHTGLPSDLVAQDIRETIGHIGTLTGEVTSEDILGNIFSKFCIGK